MDICFQSPNDVDNVIESELSNDTDQHNEDDLEDVDETTEESDDHMMESFLCNDIGDIQNFTMNGKLKKTEFTISKVEYAICVFMKEYKALLNKEDIIQLKTVKFHHLLHFPYYVRRCGSPENFDG